MRTYIEHLSDSTASDAAELHRVGINTGFLSSLGSKFLKELYGAITPCEAGFGFACRNDAGDVLGYIACTTDISHLYKEVLLRRGFQVLAPIAKQLLFPSVLRNIIQTLRYPSVIGRGLPKAEILSIAISDEARGMGIGKMLMNAAFEQFWRRGVARVKVAVGTENMPANKFYLACGFKLALTCQHHGRPMNVYVAEVACPQDVAAQLAAANPPPAAGVNGTKLVALQRTTEVDYSLAAKRASCNRIWWRLNGLNRYKGSTGPFYDQDGRWWYKPKPWFAWPVDIFTPLERQPDGLENHLLLGWQYPTIEDKADSHVILNAVRDLSGYGLEKLSAPSRQIVCDALAGLTVQAENPGDSALAQEACQMWNDQVRRTKINRSMSSQAFVDSWAELANWPGTTLLTARSVGQGNQLCGWLLARVIDGTCFIDAIAARWDQVQLKPVHALLYTCLASAAAMNIRHALSFSGGAELEAAAHSVGFSPCRFPTRTRFTWSLRLFRRRLNLPPEDREIPFAAKLVEVTPVQDVKPSPAPGEHKPAAIEWPQFHLNACSVEEHCQALIRVHQPFWWYQRTDYGGRRFAVPFRDRNGNWWYQVKPGFCWAADFFRPLEAKLARPGLCHSYLGYQHIIPSEDAYSHLCVNSITDLSSYGPGAVENKRRNFRKGFKSCSFDVVADPDDDTLAGCLRSWNDLVSRTGWKKPLDQPTFSVAMKIYLTCPGVSLIIGRDRQTGQVAGFLLTKIIGDTAYVDTIASRNDLLQLRVNDAIMYLFLMNARLLPGVNKAHYAIKSTAKALETFKASLGFTAYPFPAKTVFRLGVGTFVRLFRHRAYLRMTGQFEELAKEDQTDSSAAEGQGEGHTREQH